MGYDNELVAAKLRRWDNYISRYRLPDWSEIPDIGLYMEQVTALLRQYLNYLPPELQEEQFITHAAINNYVRKKIMPEPIRKKYYRVHIAYLVMICTLKHCLSIPTLQTMIPMGIEDGEVERIYTAFVSRHHLTAAYFSDQVRTAAAGILTLDKRTELSTCSTEDLISSAAIISGLARLLAEKLLLLNGKTPTDLISAAETSEQP